MIDPDCKNKEDKRSLRCLAILMVIFLAGRLINFVEAHFTISLIIFPVKQPGS